LRGQAQYEFAFGGEQSSPASQSAPEKHRRRYRFAGEGGIFSEMNRLPSLLAFLSFSGSATCVRLLDLLEELAAKPVRGRGRKPAEVQSV
jgi:hypothetical protein